MTLFTRSGPHPSPYQMPGEVPSTIPDVPLSTVLLVVYFIAGASHSHLLHANKKRGKKFLINILCFGLCDVRTITFCLRIAWSQHPDNIRLGLASTIFVYAGTVLLYIANLLFTQRVVRAQHPSVGWTRPIAIAFPVLVGIIFSALIMIIIVVVQQFYTRDEDILRIDRDVELVAQIIYVAMAFLPTPIILFSCAAGQWASIKAGRKLNPVDKFGRGRMLHKVVLVLISSSLLSLEAGFRCGSAWMKPVLEHGDDGLPMPQSWYYSKAAFYSFNFIPEILVVYGWLFARIDHMFHIPNGANGGYGTEQGGLEKTGRENGSQLSLAWSDAGSQVAVLYAIGPNK